MRRIVGMVGTLVFVGLPISVTWSAGTPAGTAIINQATVTYDVGPATFVASSNVTSTRVAEILNVTVTWQDAAPVTVAPGDTDRATTFLVVNMGNGSEAFMLTGLSTLGGDDFDPALNDLYLDANGDGLYDPAADVQYLAGTNDPVLAADSSVVVFVVNDIPSTTLDGELGNTQLSAATNTGTGSPGMVFTGSGDGGVDAVVGSSGGTDAGTGSYIVSSVAVSIVKSVGIADPFGGTEPVPGATMTYSLVISVAGGGTAVDVVVSDAIPANTTYVPGTLGLNSNPLTDIADADAGDVGATTPGEVTVALGDLTAVSPLQTITFAVTIN